MRAILGVLEGNKMAKDKDTIILYQKQMDKCRKFLNAEQFGRLIIALLDFAKGEDPEVDDDIAMAFEFTSLQQEIDRKKYEEICAKNRENAKKGGAPKGNQNARKNKTTETTERKKNNPNDNDNDNDNDKRMIRENNDDDKSHDHGSPFHHFGTFGNVELTETERTVLRETYERTDELIDKVSVWLRGASNEVPDHYALCVKFATNDDWPKRKKIEPVDPIVVDDPLTEEEQEELVAEMRARTLQAFEGGN